MLKAYFQSNPKLTKSGEITTITCPELNLEVSSYNPTNALCREIIRIAPERGSEQLETYRGDKLAGTVGNIGRWAQKDLIETTDRGFLEIRHRNTL